MKLGVGIIGLGVGQEHLKACLHRKDCEMVIVADFDRGKLRGAEEICPGIQITGEANEVLDHPDVDLILICSYDNYHCQQTIRALDNDKHVFVEKPLCLTRDESRRIQVKLEERKDRRLSSNLILRESPRFCEIRNRIREGELGNLFYFEAAYNFGRLEKLTGGWRGDLEFYSVVHGGAVHMVDLLLWITGEQVEEVFAWGNDICSQGTKFRFNDCVVALLKFESGVLAKITANFGCVRPHFHELSIYGTKASFVNSLPNAILFESRDPSKEPRCIDSAYRVPSKGLLLTKFIDALLAGEPAPISANEVFSAMSVCFAIEESILTHSPVQVKLL